MSEVEQDLLMERQSKLKEEQKESSLAAWFKYYILAHLTGRHADVFSTHT
jgi:hypothetical protein